MIILMVRKFFFLIRILLFTRRLKSRRYIFKIHFYHTTLYYVLLLNYYRALCNIESDNRDEKKICRRHDVMPPAPIVSHIDLFFFQ